jgi:predicted dehydrogenase
MIVYDDIEASEKIKVYDKGVIVKNTPEAVYNLMVSYRSGDIYTPQLDLTEALSIEIKHFANCIEHGGTPITDGHAGLRVVRILESATRSLKQRGKSVRFGSVSMAHATVA